MKKFGRKGKALFGAIVAITLVLTLSVSSVVFADPVDTSVKQIDFDGHTVYYSDGFFTHSSDEFDEHLATLSMRAAKYSAPSGSPTSHEDTTWYESQPDRIQGFYEAIGFSDFDCNEDYRLPTAFDTIGIGAASKQVGDYTLIGIAVRSGNYAREWGNNVWLGDGSESDYMHEGWYNAAMKLIGFLKTYMETYNIDGKIKVWISGFSRGGATTNIAAGLLDNKINEADNQTLTFASGATLTHEDLFAYTFEAPQGANVNSQSIKPPKDPIYNNIWNVVNPNDLVTKVAMGDYGFTRFGNDKFITTEFYDPANYAANRDIFKAMYVADGNTLENYKADNFTMYGTPIEKIGPMIAEIAISLPIGGAAIGYDVYVNGIDAFLEKDDTKGNYDANVAMTLFFEELTSNIGSRGDYCNKLQDNISNLLVYFMDDVGGNQKEKVQRLKDIGISFLLLASGPYAYFGGSSAILDECVSLIVNISQDDSLSDIGSLLGPVLSVVGSTWWERPNELISIGRYTSEIFQNHDTEVMLAHMEAQDSYYIDNYNQTNGTGFYVVSLRDNADMARMSFDGMNDLGLRVNGTKHVDVSGTVLGKSTVVQCDKGYAVGYYSYITEEDMELFMPAEVQYNISMKDYSKKPYHEFSYTAYYQYISPHAEGKMKSQKDHFEDWAMFNSDRYIRDVYIGRGY